MAVVVKNPPAKFRRCKRCRFDPWLRKVPWRRAWQPTPVFLPFFPWAEEPGRLQSTGSQRVRSTEVTWWSESESRSVLSDPLWSLGLHRPWDSPWTTQTMGFSKPDTGVGNLSFLQGTFPTQGLNPGLLHCRQIPYPAEPDDLTHTQINLMCMCVHKNKDYKEILQNINSGSNDLL